MPFIDCKITEKLTEEKKEEIKRKFGQAVTCLHKTETYLMAGFADGYDLYLGGKKLKKGAYLAVSLYGTASASDYEKMTQALCKIMGATLQIPADCIYITYREVSDWGWNGSNF